MTDVFQSNIIKMTLNYRMPNNDVAESVTHFQYLDPGTITEEDVLDDLEPWALGWANTWELLGSNQMELETMELAVRTIADGFVTLGERVLNITGNAVSDMLPPGTAGLLTRQVSGSSGVAKKYLPGQTESQQDEGVWDPTAIILMAAVAVAWALDPDEYLGVSRNYSQVTHQGLYNIGLLMNPTVVINPIVAYQRRRKQNVGS